MQAFREQNRFLIYLVNFSGLYMTSIENLTNQKLVIYFFTVWTKISILILPFYIGSVIVFLLLDEAPFAVKLPVFRRVIAFSTYLFKNIFFYIYRGKIEELINLWDSCFQEELYNEERAKKMKNSQKVINRILLLSWVVPLIAALIYTVPPFFSKSKKLSHPTSLPYREQSPDYEFMIIYDFFRVVMGCISSASVDLILIVFLSHILTQLTHLRDCLTDMVHAIGIDTEGKLVYRMGNQGFGNAENDFLTPYLRNRIAHSRGSTKNFNSFLDVSELGDQYIESVKEFESKLRIWILHHQQTIAFFSRIKNLFSPIASLQLVYVVFYTCFTAFHLVRAKIGIEAFTIPFIATSNLISLFVWCKIGVQMGYMSTELFGDAYGQAWFIFPKKIQTSFSFILMRCSKPMILRGISLFFINFETFFQIAKITYQLFAFVLQVSEEA